MFKRFANLISIAFAPSLEVCAHCECKVYEGGHREVINGKKTTFCCMHCARSYKETHGTEIVLKYSEGRKEALMIKCAKISLRVIKIKDEHFEVRYIFQDLSVNQILTKTDLIEVAKIKALAKKDAEKPLYLKREG